MISATVIVKSRNETGAFIDPTQISLWLIENVGANARYRDVIGKDSPWHVENKWDRSGGHLEYYLEYSFHREEDATLFALRWT
jgi:hypothetical protein